MSVTPDLKFGSEFLQTSSGASARSCIQCGKCAAICPLVRMREKYSPIEIVRGVLLGLKDTVLSSDVIWRCLSCQACTNICPAGIKFSDFIESIRKVVMDKGVIQYVLRCKRCGKIFTTTPISEFVEKLIPENVKIDEEYLMLCPNCKPYVLLNKSARWYGKGIVKKEPEIRHG